MIQLSFEKCRQAVEGSWVTSPAPDGFKGVSIDSRTIQEDELFFALEGTRTDGHKFVHEAAEKGAAGAIIEKNISLESLPDSFCVIRVKDTYDSLLDLTKFYRKRIQTTVVAVAGSNGKTTTKDMIYHLLSEKYQTKKAPKSYNSTVGVPLTLFNVHPTDDIAVLELGTNEPGEIDAVSSVAEPDLAVLTSITPTHLEGLEDIEGVKREQERILYHLRGGGKTVYNRDNEHVVDIVEKKNLPTVSYGFYQEADVEGRDISSDLHGIHFFVEGHDSPVNLPVLGSWNAYNALAAITVAKHFDISFSSIRQRFSDFTLPSMRMNLTEHNELQVLNDGYNANPRSVQFLLDEVDHYNYSGRKIFVLGDMAELGEKSTSFHKHIGTLVSSSKTLDQVHFVGDQMQHAAETCRENNNERLQIFDHQTADQAATHLLETSRPGDLIVLKGSRSMKLETIEKKLANQTQESESKLRNSQSEQS